MTPAIPRPVLGAIAVVLHAIDGEDHVLLVQRGRAPNAGSWGFPGGHVELGETATEGALRELFEETTVRAKALDHLQNIDVIQRDDAGQVTRQYLLVATLCEYESGSPTPQDDAADAKWITVDDIENSGLDLLDQVAEVARAARARSNAMVPST